MTEPVDLDHCSHPVWVAVDKAVPLAAMVEATKAPDLVHAMCQVVDKTVRAALAAVGYVTPDGLAPSGVGTLHHLIGLDEVAAEIQCVTACSVCREPLALCVQLGAAGEPPEWHVVVPHTRGCAGGPANTVLPLRALEGGAR
ncbi:hypothetical protein ACIBCH_41820 [Amycolatopsis thailandensis]|uniref:hypothetical protein n=1 Tax=Amycolatopsis thailandensis TaxID=589330 RepID=UPI0037BC42A1